MIDMMDPDLRLCLFSDLAHDEPSPAMTGKWLYGYGTDRKAMIDYDLLSMINWHCKGTMQREYDSRLSAMPTGTDYLALTRASFLHRP